VWRKMMFSDVPNLFWMQGYVFYSFTLRVDVVSELICRMMRFMDDKAFDMCRAAISEAYMKPAVTETFFNPGWMRRGKRMVPKVGNREWGNEEDYFKEKRELSAIDFVKDPSLVFSERRSRSAILRWRKITKSGMRIIVLVCSAPCSIMETTLGLVTRLRDEVDVFVSEYVVGQSPERIAAALLKNLSPSELARVVMVCGASLGGVQAFAVTSLLLANGHKTVRLAFLDSPPPWILPSRLSHLAWAMSLLKIVIHDVGNLEYPSSVVEALMLATAVSFGFAPAEASRLSHAVVGEESELMMNLLSEWSPPSETLGCEWVFVSACPPVGAASHWEQYFIRKPVLMEVAEEHNKMWESAAKIVLTLLRSVN